jgi:putative Mn2+ efflux pump MntP
MGILFFVNSIALGIALAMDAFSVSLANGLHEPHMSKARMNLIAGDFAFFQAIMPLIGWFCVHAILTIFSAFEKIIPWIGFSLLMYIGGKMIKEGLEQRKQKEEAPVEKTVSNRELFVQGIATSIDALSVGFTIAEYGFLMALVCAIIIGIVTFIISHMGLRIGKKVGTYLSYRASLLGGTILIIIGLEVLIRSFIG